MTLGRGSIRFFTVYGVTRAAVHVNITRELLKLSTAMNELTARRIQTELRSRVTVTCNSNNDGADGGRKVARGTGGRAFTSCRPFGWPAHEGLCRGGLAFGPARVATPLRVSGGARRRTLAHAPSLLSARATSARRGAKPCALGYRKAFGPLTCTSIAHTRNPKGPRGRTGVPV